MEEKNSLYMKLLIFLKLLLRYMYLCADEYRQKDKKERCGDICTCVQMNIDKKTKKKDAA